MIFNETFFPSRQPPGELICVRQAGRLNADPTYAIERAGSQTNVLGCVLSGTLHVSCGGRNHALRVGDAFLLPHDAEYRIHADAHNPPETLWLNLRGALINDLADRLFGGEEAVAACDIEGALTRVIELIADEREHMCEIAREVFGALMSIYSARRTESPAPGGESLASRYDEYVCNSVQRPFSVREMARFFGVSVDALNRSFRAQLGTTPYRYYQALRMDLARSLLATTSITIEDVASRLGFADRNYFTLCFTRATGLPPARYRRERSAARR